MRSFEAFTKEIDDLNAAVSELKSQIDTSLFLKNTCGIIFSGFEVNAEILLKELKAAFDFPFFGCSGIGMISTNGYSQTSIILLVLTADDVEFSIGLTDKINGPDDIIKFAETYQILKSKISGKDKLIFTYVPWFTNIVFDEIVFALDKASDKVPVYGGIASDGWSFDSTFVFTNNEVSSQKGVIMVVSGNVNPIFTIEQSTTLTTNLHKIVTKAEGTVVYELDGKPVTDFIRDMGLITHKSNVILDYLGTPFLASQKTYDGDEIDTTRCLAVIDHENKCCTYIGIIEVGSELNMVLISKEDIEKSVQNAFDDILEKIKSSDDYKYSTIICSSCAARYCLLVADKNAEGRAYEGKLPEGVNVLGNYIYGEFCPTHGKHTGKLYNALSNETFTILAL